MDPMRFDPAALEPTFPNGDLHPDPKPLSLAAPTLAWTIPTPPRIMCPNIGTHYRIAVAV
jgi:hypothetical protein